MDTFSEQRNNNNWKKKHSNPEGQKKHRQERQGAHRVIGKGKSNVNAADQKKLIQDIQLRTVKLLNILLITAAFGENDSRITRIGRKIRSVRIDEFPQFINILKDDMSFVGPRPVRPQIAREYEKDLPEFRLRLQAKCGLTGYAQVYGKYNTIPYDKLQMDLMYIASPSLAQDFMILISTIKILFMKQFAFMNIPGSGYHHSAE